MPGAARLRARPAPSRCSRRASEGSSTATASRRSASPSSPPLGEPGSDQRPPERPRRAPLPRERKLHRRHNDGPRRSARVRATRARPATASAAIAGLRTPSCSANAPSARRSSSAPAWSPSASRMRERAPRRVNVVDACSFAGAASDWSNSRARATSPRSISACDEKPDCVGPRDLETMRVDHAETQLRIRDGVRERTAAERHEGSGARCKAELRDQPSFSRGLHRLAAMTECGIESICAFERLHRVEERRIEVLPSSACRPARARSAKSTASALAVPARAESDARLASATSSPGPSCAATARRRSSRSTASG